MKKLIISLAVAAIGLAGAVVSTSCESHKCVEVESIDSLRTVYDGRTGRTDAYWVYYTDEHGTPQSIEVDRFTYLKIERQSYWGTIVLEYSLFDQAYQYAYTMKEDKVTRFHEPDTIAAEAQPDKEMKKLVMPMYAKLEPQN